MIDKRLLAALAAAVVVAGCAKESAAPAGGAPAVSAQPPSSQSLLAMHADKIEVTPATVRSGEPVTTHVQLSGAPPAAQVTLSWFGPDGGLVYDDTKDAAASTLTFTSPAEAFREPGRYHADLHSDVVHLGEASIDVRG